MPADLKRLHEYMLEVEHIGIISDEMRAVVEELWPELAHKLPPKKPRDDHGSRLLMSALPLRVQLVTATLLVVYRQGFQSPRSSAVVD